MTKPGQVSATGKLLIAVLCLAVLQALSIHWDGTGLNSGFRVVYTMQIGLLIAAVLFSGRFRMRIFVEPVFVLWFTLFLYVSALAVGKVDTWEIIKRSALVFLPRVLLILAVLRDRTPVQTFFCVAKGFVVIVTGLVILGALTRWYGDPATVVRFDGRTQQVQRWSLGSLSFETAFSRYGDFIRFSAPIGSGNPNTLGALLWTSMLLTIGLSLTRRLSTAITAGFLFIQLGALLATLSRTSWLTLSATVILLLFLLAWSMPRRFIRFALSLVIFAPIVLVLVFRMLSSFGSERVFLLAVDRTIETGVAGRTKLWLAGLDAFMKNPFSGIGFGMSQKMIIEPAGSGLSSLHNAYIELAAETGLFGLALFLMMIATSIGIGIHKARKSLGVARMTRNAACRKDAFCRRMILLVGSASAFGIFVYSFSESIMLQGHVASFLWTYLLAMTSAVGMSMLHRQETESSGVVR